MSLYQYTDIDQLLISDINTYQNTKTKSHLLYFEIMSERRCSLIYNMYMLCERLVGTKAEINTDSFRYANVVQ